MARKFITTRELALVNAINKEFIQGVVEQEVLYYAISIEDSSVDDLYEEAIRKEFHPPVRVNGRIEFHQTATTTKGGTMDATYTVDVKLHVAECVERNVRPREGDFVEFGQVMFEITTVGYDQPVFGQMNDKLSYKLTCVSSRESQFKADNVSVDGVDNTHPVEPARPRTLGDDL